jgi:fatty-acyl-CoA synthase
MVTTTSDITAAGTATPTTGGARRVGGFATQVESLEFAARGATGFNFHDARGRLERAAPYSDIAATAMERGRKLAGLGLPRNARIGLLAEANFDFVTLFFACHYAGLLPVPLPSAVRLGGENAWEQQLARLLAGCGASAAFSSAANFPVIRQAAIDAGVRISGTPDFVDGLDRDGPLAPLKPEEYGYLQFSSGSTRTPMGVAATQLALGANCTGLARDGAGAREGDRVVSWLPLYHDMGLVGCMLSPMAAQLSVDYLSPDSFARRPLLWLELISRNRGTIATSPTFGYALCTRRADRQGETNFDLASWRVAGLGGEMIRADVLEAFAERFAKDGFERSAFVPSYGLAEASLTVSFTPPGSGFRVDAVDLDLLESERRARAPKLNGHPIRQRNFVRCGRPLPEHDVEIRAEDGSALPDRSVGAVFVRGPSIMTEYFNQPEATARVLTTDRWLNTGDLGYMVDGELVITGRSKDLILLNGRNIWPEDIEWAVEQLSEVRNRATAAFSITLEDGAEAPIILVESGLSDAFEREARARAVHAAIQERLGVDCGVVLVPPRSLPYTSSGKLSRSKAKQLFLSGRFSSDVQEAAAVGVVAQSAASVGLAA